MNSQQTLLFALLLELINCGSCIYNGSFATHGQFRFVVQVKHGRAFTLSTHCTGTIISRCWVLTSAHCVAEQEYNRLEIPSNKKDWITRITAGHIGIDVEDDGKAQFREAAQVYIHPDAYDEKEFRIKWHKWLMSDQEYDYDYSEYAKDSLGFTDVAHELAVTMGEGVDVALLCLNKPFEFNEYVGKIGWAFEMPTMEMRDCFAIGFGTTRQDESYDVIFKEQHYMPVRMGGGDFCKAVMPDGNLEYIKPYHVCVVGGVPFGNVCAGDSGGPVVCGDVMYGVASKEPNTVTTDWCGEVENTPMFYTSTAGVKEWIVRTMQPAKHFSY